MIWLLVSMINFLSCSFLVHTVHYHFDICLPDITYEKNIIGFGKHLFFTYYVVITTNTMKNGAFLN
uniref:Uncharacterized protein n=1 Tax=Arundo donax TaxID=35708 RepID=A0A0A9C6Z3_ARUDO